MNIIDLMELGTELDVYKSGKRLGTILVIQYEDLIHETIGEYDDRFESYAEYMMELHARIKDHVSCPYNITWYTLPNTETLDINDVATQTVREGNNIVVVEYLD
jgi:hypothetical protein